MNRSKEPKIIYYSADSEDFFAQADGLPTIDENYEYIKRSLPKRLWGFMLYRIVAPLPAFVYSHFHLRDKFIGKEKLARYKRSGCFIYSNHTQAIGDAVTPNMLCFPKPTYVIVKKENLSLPVIKKNTAYLGAIPLPDGLRAARNFTKAIQKRISEGAAIVVYPEAHVWPYYTGIREFGAETLEPVMKCDAPVFTATRVYKSRGEGKRPRSVIYIDGPFFRDPALSKREAREKLSYELREAMKKRAELSDCEYIKYIKREDAPANTEEEPPPDGAFIPCEITSEGKNEQQ